MDLEEMLDDLEKDVGDLEKDFDEARDEDASETVREKQQRAEDILNEIHRQLDFLKQQVKQNG